LYFHFTDRYRKIIWYWPDISTCKNTTVLNIITVTNTHYRYNQTPAALKTRLHDIFVIGHLRQFRHDFLTNILIPWYLCCWISYIFYKSKGYTLQLIILLSIRIHLLKHTFLTQRYWKFLCKQVIKMLFCWLVAIYSILWSKYI